VSRYIAPRRREPLAAVRPRAGAARKPRLGEADVARNPHRAARDHRVPQSHRTRDRRGLHAGNPPTWRAGPSPTGCVDPRSSAWGRSSSAAPAYPGRAGSLPASHQLYIFHTADTEFAMQTVYQGKRGAGGARVR
jgi:hypothetical protein